MDSGTLFGSGISFPPRVGPDGRVAWSVGEQNVRESIRLILLTNPNERVRLPEFGSGLKSFLFEPNNPATHHLMEDQIQQALRRWESRVVVQSVDVEPDPDDAESAIASITFKLVATQSTERVTLGITLQS